MWKFLVALFFLIPMSLVQASEPGSCEQSAQLQLVGQPLSVSQMETAGLKYAARNPKAPQVPFAYGNKTWRSLKAQYRLGDKFFAYTETLPPSTAPYARGYALVRGKCVIGSIRTRTG